MKPTLLVVALVVALTHAACSIENNPTNDSPPKLPTQAPSSERMKIRLTVGDKVITATLSDSKTAREFAALLPLTLTLKDYAGTEKISDLPRRLSTEDAPAGIDPSVGDITYYAPWGNLALFYRDYDYSGGLVILGKIDGGIETFNVPGSLQVRMELLGTP